ncbi:12-oxophytodienoate reductase 11 isoform B [Chlorella sorokiniana]|uniref:12-oxophytodienoate reductase 11 isoform B n=1 Tax=Chlorella sorokiniana TaxID=3076 RepID=A0A2P6TNW1_CHLSO|nr:12-oxophytodienoate reductase 11 isoform B [Chlorella sorokiniana]|eukprot:PRW51012.1 12-oxophytodienoate reductase 11 isoform B [Chlorella sorokiniana]
MMVIDAFEAAVHQGWVKTILLDLAYTAYLVPLSLAFDNMEGPHAYTFFTYLNIVGTAFYIADIAMGFHTGFICDVRRALIMEAGKVAQYYVRHGGFWVDLIAALPIIPELVFSSVPSDATAYKWFYALRLLRLARVFRLLKVWGGSVFSNTLARGLQRFMSTAVLYFCNLLVGLSVLVNLMVAVCFMAASIFYFSFAINAMSDLLHGFSRQNRQAEALRRKLEDAEAWMQERHIPTHLQTKVRRYLVQVWAPHAGIDDAEQFDALPVELRGEIVNNLAGDSLRQCKMFHLLDDAMRAQLAAMAEPVRLVAGHDLYREADDADSFFILQEGEYLIIEAV